MTSVSQYPISFNIMEDVGADKRHLVVNGLMATFEKIWVDAWSARMAYILQNTLLALLEYPGSTLLGVNRMLVDKDYRNTIVNNVTDPSVKSFWVDEFAKYTDRYTQEATPAIQNKVGQFASNPLIRNIIGQSKSTFDLRELMDQKKIVIVNLSKGKVGEGNAKLLGSMFITKIYLAAMSRADVTDATLQQLPNFYLYVDEFQSFANKSFADILSEARKYKLNLTLAHQYIEQMEEEVRAAVFGNVGTMISFRVGAFDAEVLEKEFAPTFTAEDMVNLGIFQIYLKLMIDSVSSQPFSAVTMAPIEKLEIVFRQDIIENSRKTFARERDSIESEIKSWHEQKFGLPKPERPKDQVGEQKWGDQRTDMRRPVKTFKESLIQTNFASSEKVSSGNLTDKQNYLGQVSRQPDKERREVFQTVVSGENQKNFRGLEKTSGGNLTQTNFALQNSNEQAGKQEKVPLEKLKSPEQKKQATPEHVSQLRAALAELTQKQQINQQPTTNNPSQIKTQFDPSQSRAKTDEASGASNQQPTTNNQQPTTNSQIKKEEKKAEPELKKEQKEAQKTKVTNEIPEDELKKLLQVDL